MSSLDCGPDRPIAMFSALVGDDGKPGGPSTPEEALAAYFQREGVTVGFGRVRAATDVSAEVVYDDGARRVFSAYVEKIGDDWHVTEYAACGEWLGSLPREGMEAG